MSEWVHYALDNGYWKYLISNLGNSPKPQPAHEPSTSSSRNENGRYSPQIHHQKTKLLLPLLPLQRRDRAPKQGLQPRRHSHHGRKTHNPLLLGRDSTLIQKEWGKQNAIRILLMTDFATDREVKTQYRQLARIYHPDKYDQTSTQMTPRQSEEHFKLINNAYEFLQNIL